MPTMLTVSGSLDCGCIAFGTDFMDCPTTPNLPPPSSLCWAPTLRNVARLVCCAPAMFSLGCTRGTGGQDNSQAIWPFPDPPQGEASPAAPSDTSEAANPANRPAPPQRPTSAPPRLLDLDKNTLFSFAAGDPMSNTFLHANLSSASTMKLDEYESFYASHPGGSKDNGLNGMNQALTSEDTSASSPFPPTASPGPGFAPQVQQLSAIQQQPVLVGALCRHSAPRPLLTAPKRALEQQMQNLQLQEAYLTHGSNTPVGSDRESGKMAFPKGAPAPSPIQPRFPAPVLNTNQVMLAAGTDLSAMPPSFGSSAAGPQGGGIGRATGGASTPAGQVQAQGQGYSDSAQGRRGTSGPGSKAASRGAEFEGRDQYRDLNSLARNIHTVAKDQHGCRFLQKCIEEDSPGGQDTARIYEELLPHLADLMIDPFGNYLLQKLLEHCTDAQRTEIVKQVAPDMFHIATNTHGTRAMQKLVDCITSSAQTFAVIGALQPHVVLLIKDLNGNHVIQKCLANMGPQDRQFVYDAIAGRCADVATHRHGCCVLQRCIDHAADDQKTILINEIVQHALMLVQDPFGNYVIQYVLDLDDKSVNQRIMQGFHGNIASLSVNKFSSNVIEKCFRNASDETKQLFIDELTDPQAQFVALTRLRQLLQDGFANYVIQTAMTLSTPAQFQQLQDAIKPMLHLIRNTPYGKKIENKLNKRHRGERGVRGGGGTARWDRPIDRSPAWEESQGPVLAGMGQMAPHMGMMGMMGMPGQGMSPQQMQQMQQMQAMQYGQMMPGMVPGVPGMGMGGSPMSGMGLMGMQAGMQSGTMDRGSMQMPHGSLGMLGGMGMGMGGMGMNSGMLPPGGPMGAGMQSMTGPTVQGSSGVNTGSQSPQ
eukprot:gene5366-958_t